MREETEMTVYKNSKADLYYADGVTHGESCQVRIGEDGSIALSYQGDSGPVVYEGKEIEAGHYVLKAASVNGQATLHKVPNEDVLEGWWLEAGNEGMWRIDLDE
jgi:hypothetical protein